MALDKKEGAMGTGLMIGMLMVLGILVWALAARMIEDAEHQSRVRSEEQSTRR
jgi:hypothetical protein